MCHKKFITEKGEWFTSFTFTPRILGDPHVIVVALFSMGAAYIHYAIPTCGWIIRYFYLRFHQNVTSRRVYSWQIKTCALGDAVAVSKACQLVQSLQCQYVCTRKDGISMKLWFIAETSNMLLVAECYNQYRDNTAHLVCSTSHETCVRFSCT